MNYRNVKTTTIKDGSIEIRVSEQDREVEVTVNNWAIPGLSGNIQFTGISKCPKNKKFDELYETKIAHAKAKKKELACLIKQWEQNRR